MKKQLKIFFAYFLFFGSIPFIAAGQVDSVDDVGTVLGNVMTFLQTLLFALAAIFIIIAAYKFLTAGGDEEQFKEAKRMITYTIVAVVIAIVAGSVVPLVESILGVDDLSLLM